MRKAASDNSVITIYCPVNGAKVSLDACTKKRKKFGKMSSSPTLGGLIISKYTLEIDTEAVLKHEDEEQWTDISSASQQCRTKPSAPLESLAPVPVTRPRSMTASNTTPSKCYPLCETLISNSLSPRHCLTQLLS